MIRPEQSGVAGLDVTADTVDWRCELCAAHVSQPRLDAILPPGWMHVLCQAPPANRISLVCRNCAETTTIAKLADKQLADHQAWIVEETKWIAEQSRRDLEELRLERQRIDEEIARINLDEANHAVP